MLKMNVFKFIEKISSLITDLNKFYTGVVTADKYDFGEYSKKIGEFIDRLEDLRNKKTIAIGK